MSEANPNLPGSGSGLTPDMRQDIVQLITQTMQTLNAGANAGIPGNPGNVQQDPDKDFTDLRWRPQDIGFFDPKLDEAHGKGDYVTVGTNTYWRNVYMFVDQVRDNGTGPRAAVVRQNLSSCLRGEASAWYMDELNELHRTSLKFSRNGVED